jgi:hypothetical protein
MIDGLIDGSVSWLRPLRLVIRECMCFSIFAGCGCVCVLGINVRCEVRDVCMKYKLPVHSTDYIALQCSIVVHTSHGETETSY